MKRFLLRLVHRPNIGGITIALVFWWRSLEPLLLPRTWLAQGLVSGVCFAVGYMLGTLTGACVHRILARLDRRPDESLRARVWRAVPFVVALVLTIGAVRWIPTQNSHRDLVQMPHLGVGAVPPMMIVSLFAAALLMGIGRVVWMGVRHLQRLLDRIVPSAAAAAIAVVVAVFVGSWLSGVAGAHMHSWANSVYGALEDDNPDGLTAPTSPTVSGGPGSEVAWDDLGRQGREFVAGGTSVDQLGEFAGGADQVEVPVRVYVGLRSADTARERADLAVRELDRTGAFERKALVVWTVTGTGWVDPAAARAFEQMWHGDTAIVSMQYSFLPSWMSTLVDGPVAREAGAELFDAVHAHWSEMPENARPKLYVFGLSLGSYGAEAAFTGDRMSTSIANLVSRTDGALFVGPTNANSMWQQLTRGRAAGSPEWRPIIEDGSTVRFADQVSDVAGSGDAWSSPRVLYLQHPTDPVTFWNWQTMWSRPDWLEGERGRGVATGASWFPFVTWAQLVGDLSAGFGTDPGFGHDYTDSYVAAWAAMAAPEGWTPADTSRLEDFLAESG